MFVHQLASELNISSRALLARCKQEGMAVSHHSESLTIDQVRQIRGWYASQPVSPPVAEQRPADAPPSNNQPSPWMRVVGCVFGGMTLVYLMVLVVVDQAVTPSNRFLVVGVFSFGAGLSTGFLMGDAAVRGGITLPFARRKPLAFGATGGIAVLLIVLIVGALLTSSVADEYSFKFPADPESRGTGDILYQPDNATTYPRASVEGVEVDNKLRTVSGRLTAGAKTGWFRTIHLSNDDGPTLAVTYTVSRTRSGNLKCDVYYTEAKVP